MRRPRRLSLYMPSHVHVPWLPSAQRSRRPRASRVPPPAGLTRRPRPSWSLASEPRHGVLDLAALLGTGRCSRPPRGNGHPVLALPWLLTGDPETALLRSALRALGHRVSGWSLGTNRGPTGRSSPSSEPGSSSSTGTPASA
jgi:hypothetical protein